MFRGVSPTVDAVSKGSQNSVMGRTAEANAEEPQGSLLRIGAESANPTGYLTPG